MQGKLKSRLFVVEFIKYDTDGSYRYWQDRGRCIGSRDHKSHKWVGAITDITEQKEAQRILREAETRYRIVAEHNYDR